MKKIFSLILLGCFILSCSQSNKENKSETQNGQKKLELLIKGSDTVLPLAQKLAEMYMKEHPESEITIVGGGSGVGIAALLDGTTDIAMASRSLKTDEKTKLKDKGKNAEELTIAHDALSVIVNKENPVSKLTREQLEAIFTGKITNWKDVGGSDAKIVYYSRETSSGTYEFFREHVLNKKNFGNDALLMPATGAIVQSVMQTKGAIAYIGMAYDTPEVKAISVSYDGGKEYVSPSIDAAKDGSYPISRPLFFYFEEKTEKSFQPFLDYILSQKGQNIVREVGYVPLSKNNTNE